MRANEKSFLKSILICMIMVGLVIVLMLVKDELVSTIGYAGEVIANLGGAGLLLSVLVILGNSFSKFCSEESSKKK